MEILSTIHSPEDLRKLPKESLDQLAREIRDYLVKSIPSTGGHLVSSLGVVELTIALHYLYQTPRDLLIWDIGHQTYVHKILTGRQEALKTVHQNQGISGFPDRTESPHDVFGTGHASTSISAALGFAAARDLNGERHKVVSIIGDGSLTGGLAYEGLNNAGQSHRNLLVILNDNNMSISSNVGAIANYLNMIITNPFYEKVKAEVWDFTAKLPPLTEKIRSLVRRTQDSIKSFILPGLFFEDLGFRYFGPINGHNLDELLHILGRIKDLPGPIFLHVLTKKGKGYLDAEREPQKYSVSVASRKTAHPENPSKPTYTEVFGRTITQLAEKSHQVCAITAAMGEDTGLSHFQKVFPERFFDVGIAEGHAVTFAAGMAAAGNRPAVAVYSTFFQRAFDQVLHDTAIQRLPVVFALDRSGVVAKDGPTHHGSFDISYLNLIPNLIVAAPKDGQELRNLLYTAYIQDRLPFTIRYPEDQSPEDVDFETDFREIPIGSWEVVHPGKGILILAAGTMVSVSLAAIPRLQKNGINPTVVNCRYIKPLDEKLLQELLQDYREVYTIEENALAGGFGQKIAAYAHTHRLAEHSHIYMKGIPDEFVAQGERNTLLEKLGLTARKIASWILKEEGGHKGADRELSEKESHK